MACSSLPNNDVHDENLRQMYRRFPVRNVERGDSISNIKYVFVISCVYLDDHAIKKKIVCRMPDEKEKHLYQKIIQFGYEKKIINEMNL